MRKMMIGLILSGLISESLAASSEFEAAVGQAKQIAQSKKADSYIQANNFSPQTVFDHYSKNPEQTQYYGGVTQTHTEQLTRDALQSKNSESGKVISNSINTHPRFVINQSDPDIQHSQLLQREAYNIIHGMTSQYIDCKPKQACTIQYEKKQCEEAPQLLFQSCKKKLTVEIISHEKVTHYPLTAHLSVKKHDYAGVSMNTVNGRIDFLGPHDASFKLEGRLPGDIDCRTLQGAITSRTGKARLDSINFPSCSNELGLNFHLSNGHKLDLQIDIASKVVTYEVKDHWIDDCSGISHISACKLKSQQCDIPGSTQIIQGIPVSRDCWQHKLEYICRGGSGEGNCQSLHNQGCEQVGSECKEQGQGQCSLYRQTYRCPIQSCSPTTDVVCGNGQEYCLDGKCTDRSYQQSADFAKGVSALSAIADAAKQLDQSALTIFTGHPAECSEKPVGFSNCCTETGWGQDVGLDNCSDAAKKLHVDRENKRAIKVGRYCSGPEPFPCLEHAQVFCVFSSKLAKILQEQGRVGQLNIPFGSAKEPNCQGITSEQLQSLDLTKMDFQDFIHDLSKSVKNPDLKQIQEAIQKQVQQSKQAGQTHV